MPSFTESTDERSTACPIPEPPWRSSGRIHLALVRSDRQPSVPAGFSALPGQLVAITLVRYLEGPLRYDELVVGPLVRCGARVGIWVENIWVDDAVSVRGGREIWGLPKQLARFSWAGQRVEVKDHLGTIASLSLAPVGRALPMLPMVCPGFGLLDDRFTHVLVRFRARIGLAGLSVQDWSPRFGFTPSKPLAVFGAERFDAVVDRPSLLHKRPAY